MIKSEDFFLFISPDGSILFSGAGPTTPLHPLAGNSVSLSLPKVFLIYVCHWFFFTSLGLWLSLRCRSTRQARLIMTSFLIVVFISSFMLENTVVSAAINPAFSWYALSVSPVEWEGAEGQCQLALRGAFFGAIVYSLAGLVLWRLSFRRFMDDPF